MSTETAAWLQSLGLLFDILGVILLFKFGIPPLNRNDYQDILAVSDEDADAKKKEGKFDTWGEVGLVSLIIGFTLQILPSVPIVVKSLIGK